jgi:signal transduction histidine kinase/two-component SAPR family response regulator
MNRLRILHLEDNPLDTELVQLTLEAEGLACEIFRVETRDDFMKALERREFDIILSDYSLPAFDGLSAMRMVAEKNYNVPFLIITGTLGEEVAIETLKSGATDYVLKHRLSRLVPSMRRALREAEERAERKRAEMALRDNLALHTTLVESLQMGVLVENDSQLVLNANRMFCDLFAFNDPHDLVGKDANQIFESLRSLFSNPKGFIRQLETHRKNGKPVISEELLMANKQILERDYLPIMLGPERLGHLWLFRNVTDRRHLEEQFQHSQKMDAIGQLAGGVAHDFNNLLTIIIGFASILMSRFSADEPGRQEVEEIEKAGRRAASLTGQLLAFSRKQMMRMEELDLNTIILEMEKMLRRIIGEDIELVTLLEPALALIKVDHGQMSQVIMNLAVNARDAMPQGGKLLITTSTVELDEGYALSHAQVKPGQYILFTVSDNGTGMSKETQEHIFEPFFTTKEPGKGTGLGLSMVYGIIKQTQGHIWVYSEEGHGTTFKIYLPTVQTIESSRVVEKGKTSLRGSETILLVEDEEALRNLARRVLEMNGYTVLEASNGNEAIAVCENQSRNIDLVVTDIIMPQMGGIDLVNRLKINCPDIRILFITGYTDNTMMHSNGVEQGIALLQKPFSPDSLARKVREVMDMT